MSPRSRRADRWIWSEEELDAVVSWLHRWKDGEPLQLSDLALAAQHFTGGRRTARALRTALVASGRLEHRIARGRRADYVLVPRSVAPAGPSPTDDDETPDDPESTSGSGSCASIVFWFLLASSLVV